MDLQAHVGVRVLRWAGSHSKPIPVSTSVLAGSKFSNSYARLYLYDILEDLHYKFPIHVGLHVDDVAMQYHGDIEEGIIVMEAASLAFASSIGKRALKISPKSTIVSSKPAAAKELARRLKRGGVHVAVDWRVRDLGV